MRSLIYDILRNRPYLGEIRHEDKWFPGNHPPLIDVYTFERVQKLVGIKTHFSHESVYGSALVTCGHCGRLLVCEIKIKKSRFGEREYRYYRCSRYTEKGHPRHRANETSFDATMKEVFRSLKTDQETAEWIRKIIRLKSEYGQDQYTQAQDETRSRMKKLEQKRKELLEMRLDGQIRQEMYAAKDEELEAEWRRLKLELEGGHCQSRELADLAIKAFELSQVLDNKRDSADIPEKRAILEILCLNYSFDGVSLCYEMRKPFDVLSKGLQSKDGSGDRI